MGYVPGGPSKSYFKIMFILLGMLGLSLVFFMIVLAFTFYK